MTVEISLTVPARVEKYIRHNLNQSAMRVGKGSLFYVFLLGILEKTGKPVILKRTPNLILKIAEADFRNKAYDFRYEFPFVSDQNQDHFAFLVEEVMRRELFARLDMIVERGEANRRTGKIKTEITRFLTKFSIDESEWPYDTVKKAYYRHRKALNGSAMQD